LLRFTPYNPASAARKRRNDGSAGSNNLQTRVDFDAILDTNTADQSEIESSLSNELSTSPILNKITVGDVTRIDDGSPTPATPKSGSEPLFSHCVTFITILSLFYFI